MEVASLLRDVRAKDTKFIVVTGGVCSSLGKGVLVAALGVLLKNAGYSLSVIKWDPYLNVDPGTMSPLVHGEVFVTSDGAETDLDLGHYERHIGLSLTRDSSVTAGQIYQEVLDGEREGKYLGKNIQLIPHVVDAIKKRLLTFAINHDVKFVLVEIGGTVGDIEADIFLEALRQLRMDLGCEHLLYSHLGYVPFLSWTGEVKTKPTQHSVERLKQAGLVPDCLFLRADREVDASSLDKLSMMCGVKRDRIFQMLTFDPVSRAFLDLDRQQVGQKVQEHFKLPAQTVDLSDWKSFINLIDQSQQTLRIGLVAKYVGSNDPYISVIEAIKSAGYHCQRKVKLEVIEAEALEKADYGSDSPAWKQLKEMDGIVVPGGFDKRGVEGKILAARWAREHNMPYLGLCLGMQIIIIEAARHLLGLKDANSAEFFADGPHPVIWMMEAQKSVTRKGGSMRLGSYPCTLVPGSKAHSAYGKDLVDERHRHRYEVNNVYRKDFEKVGIVFSGIYKEKDLVEISEYKDHPYMVGSQFHPEFQSSPLQVHPLFRAFMEAVVQEKLLHTGMHEAKAKSVLGSVHNAI